MIEDDQPFEGTLHLDIHAARALRDLLEYFNQMWPGAPARPYQEQEFAQSLLKTVNQIILEHNFTYLDHDINRRKEGPEEGEGSPGET